MTLTGIFLRKAEIHEVTDNGEGAANTYERALTTNEVVGREIE